MSEKGWSSPNIDALMALVKWKALPYHGPDEDGIPYATHEGVLRFCGFDLKCVQLSDGRRVIDQQDFERLLGIK